MTRTLTAAGFITRPKEPESKPESDNEKILEGYLQSNEYKEDAKLQTNGKA